MRREEEIKHNSSKKPEKGGGVFPKRVPYAILVLLMGVAAIALFVALILLDLFPKDLVIVIISIMVVMLVLASVLLARRRRWKRIVGLLIAIVFVFGVASVSSYLYSTYEMMNKVSENDNFSNAEEVAGTFDPTQESFNLYITGIDQWASEKGYDLERSDVNMIVTVNPVTKKILLTSIPRDTYVKLHTAQQMDKLTHTGVYGVDETINTVQDWLDIDLNYYVKLNFSALRDVINAMGGIDVYSPVEFESSLKGYHYNKGWNHLDGKEALYFARERHAFEGQDSVRVENQQRVVKAIIDKLTSSTTLMTSYGDIMKVAGDNLHTNMSYDEIQSLVKMQMSDLASWEVETQKIEGEYDMDYVASLTQSRKFVIYRPDFESVNDCLGAINRVLKPSASQLEEARKNNTKGFIVNAAKRVKEQVEKKYNNTEEESEE